MPRAEKWAKGIWSEFLVFSPSLFPLLRELLLFDRVQRRVLVVSGGAKEMRKGKGRKLRERRIESRWKRNCARVLRNLPFDLPQRTLKNEHNRPWKTSHMCLKCVPLFYSIFYFVFINRLKKKKKTSRNFLSVEKFRFNGMRYEKS